MVESKSKFPIKGEFHKKKQIEEFERDLPVNDIITSACTVEQVSKLKAIYISTFQDAGLHLQKWIYNGIQLEGVSLTLKAEGNM